MYVRKIGSGLMFATSFRLQMNSTHKRHSQAKCVCESTACILVCGGQAEEKGLHAPISCECIHLSWHRVVKKPSDERRSLCFAWCVLLRMAQNAQHI